MCSIYSLVISIPDPFRWIMLQRNCLNKAKAKCNLRHCTIQVCPSSLVILACKYGQPRIKWKRDNFFTMHFYKVHRTSYKKFGEFGCARAPGRALQVNPPQQQQNTLRSEPQIFKQALQLLRLTEGPKLFVCLSSYHKVNNWHVKGSLPFNSRYIHILTRLQVKSK